MQPVAQPAAQAKPVSPKVNISDVQSYLSASDLTDGLPLRQEDAHPSD